MLALAVRIQRIQSPVPPLFERMCALRSILPNVLGDAFWKLAMCAQGRSAPESAFTSLTVPSISMGEYLERLIRCLHDADVESVLIVAMIYLRRADTRKTVIDRYSAHRLLASATWASMKFLLDWQPSLRTFGKLAGLRKAEVIRLEAHFVHGLQWRLGVTHRTFDIFRKGVLSLCFAPFFPPQLLDKPEGEEAD